MMRGDLAGRRQVYVTLSSTVREGNFHSNSERPGGQAARRSGGQARLPIYGEYPRWTRWSYERDEGHIFVTLSSRKRLTRHRVA